MKKIVTGYAMGYTQALMDLKGQMEGILDDLHFDKVKGHIVIVSEK